MKRVLLTLLILIFITSSVTSFNVNATNVPPSVETYHKAYIDTNGKSGITFGKVNKGRGYEIKEYGISISETNINPRVGSENVFLYPHSNKTDALYGVELKDKKSCFGEGYYAVAYVKYLANNITYIVYGDVISVDIRESSLFGGGAGTPEKPFIISGADHFNNIRYHLGSVFEIVEDIDLTRESYKPISGFSGKISGNDKENLKTITVDILSDSIQTGLFSQASGYEIRNLRLSGSVRGTKYVGGLVGYGGGIIENCVNQASVYGSGDYVGGIIGFNASLNTTIKNVKNIADISGNAFVGGIAGGFGGKTVNVSNNGAVTATYNAAGIAGTILNNASITESYNAGTVTALSEDGRSGGLIGSGAQGYAILNCYNTGAIDAKGTQNGGLTGALSAQKTVNIKNCYNIGTLKNEEISPIAANNANASECYYLENGRDYSKRSGIACSVEELKSVAFSGGILAMNNDTRYLFQELAGFEHYTIPVDIEKFQQKVNSAYPGEEVVLKNGAYENVVMKINTNGRAGLPIVIRAETPGNVTFTGNADITVTGEYIELFDFQFRNIRLSNTESAVKLIGANHCRVSSCYFYDVFGTTDPNSNSLSITDASSYNRADHNVFEYSEGIGSSSAGGLNAYNKYNTLDHNYFKDIPDANDIYHTANALEALAMFSVSAYLNQESHLTVEYNLFENCIGDNSEVVSNKSSKNVYRYNTFLNSSEPCFRSGKGSVFDNNFVIGSKSGIRSHGMGNIITNNYIFSTYRGMQFRASDSHALKTWGPTYTASEDVVIANNTIIYPLELGLSVGEYFSPSEGYMHEPRNITLANNLVVTDSAGAYSIVNATDSRIENNIAAVSGSGSAGTEIEGITVRDMDIVFDGELYVPANIRDLENRGVYIKEVEEFSREKGLESGIDIGVNKLSDESVRKGLLTANDVGPVNKWWMSQLNKEPVSAFDFLNSMSLALGKSSIYTQVGESYNLNAAIRRYFDKGRVLNINSRDITYTVKSGQQFISLSGMNVTGASEGTAIVTAAYKGKTADIRVNVVSSRVRSEGEYLYQNEFDNVADKNGMEVIGGDDWRIEDGALSNSGKVAEANSFIIDHSVKLAGNYTLSCDMKLENVGESSLRGIIYMGYIDGQDKSHYQILLGDALTSSGIYALKAGVTTQIGQISKVFEAGREYRIDIKKAGGRIIVLADGDIVGIADISEGIEGKIGYGSEDIVVFDNVLITRDETPVIDDDPHEMDVTAVRTDAEEITFTMSRIAPDGNSIFRVYRDGVWIADSNEEEYVHVNTHPDREYIYKLEEVGANGDMYGQKIMKFTCPSTPSNDFFMITNPLTKSELDQNLQPGVYLEGNLRIKNKGLKVGDFKHVDSAYKFDEAFFDLFPIFKEFEGRAFVGVSNADRFNPMFYDENCDDYYKFDINKSATVYYLAYYSSNIINSGDRATAWSRKNGWDVINLSNMPISENTLYVKHYDVSDGETVTVKVGGLKSPVSVTGQIFVIPD